MDILVEGGQTLSGEIYPSGSKNSAVALIPVSILFDTPVTFENIPDITDVVRLTKIMEKLGSKISWDKEKKSMEINNASLRFENLDKDDLGSMKGTSLLWGPMLARFKKVVFEDLPGGCTLGVRSLDAHYNAFETLGVKIIDGEKSAKMDATNAKAQTVWLTEMSPSGTENIIMLAASLKGKTTIINAASEPQVQDLCNFLVKAGAHISGIGSSIIVIEGGFSLTPVKHKIFSDHLEVITFLALGAATGGEIIVHDSHPEFFSHINHVFSQFNINIKHEGDSAKVEKNTEIRINPDNPHKTLVVRAQPWPSLPVDALPLFIPLALAAKSGNVLFHNWMYESGLFWTSELTKLGGDTIICDPHRVIVHAGSTLKGATLEAPYIIRATVALTMAAMIAQGESKILNADTLYRGHPHFSENLRKLGAKIREEK
jgi:UDP-N-acetylglucosamine 1-carboxyvinyltransferase